MSEAGPRQSIPWCGSTTSSNLQQGWHDGPFAHVPAPRIQAIFDDLLGSGRWTWDEVFGWWPVLFPGFAADKSVPDLGWHVDSDEYRPTLRVPEKAVVTIFYFSDAARGEGGTAVFPGSHLDVARILADAEPGALNDDNILPLTPRPRSDGDMVEVTGRAADVLFAHPFLVHASSHNIGSRVRFACNPHVDLLAPMQLERTEAEQSLIEIAVTRALASR